MSDERPLTEEERAASIDVDIDSSYSISADDGYMPDEWRDLLKKAQGAGLDLPRTDDLRSELVDSYDVDIHLSVTNPPAWLSEGLDGPPPEPEVDEEDPELAPFIRHPAPVHEDQETISL